jgi:cysteinyl-tRNA synthetase
MSTLHLHNTMSRQKEPFVPLDPSNIRMYVCGPTVYDFAHIGNARPMVVFDTLYRLLKRLYPKVTYCRNITDIDDKIIAKSKESGEPIDVITKKTTRGFHEDLAHLNTLQPDVEPKATETVPQMIALVELLIQKGFAYEAGGHVLFHVPAMKNYGGLSRFSRDELIAGARIEVAPYKQDPADFILWKPSGPDQPGWESPWGRGRPGWHLECSAMSKEHLSVTFDIHGGGLDLIFPHHENEIAQSSCAHAGAPLAKYWVHNGFLIVNGEKMSKSLGNFFTIRDLLAEAPGEALRLALLSTHYRQPLDFTTDGLKQAKATLDRWYSALRNVKPSPLAGEGWVGGPSVSAVLPDTFESALLDDLNTPLAIAAIHELVTQLNSAIAPTEKARLKSQLLACGDALGLLQQDPEVWCKGCLPTDGLTESEIETQIAARLAARKAKNFAEADRIRDTLAAQGIILEDSSSGTTWRRE